jgi:periplasmic mercuric ion binding protein
MKKMNLLKYFAAMLFGVIVLSLSMQAADTKMVNIKTNACTEECKAKLEKGLKDVDGISQLSLNLDDHVLAVQYDPAKTDPDKIRKSIAKIGYNADDVKASKADDCSTKCGDKKSIKTTKSGCCSKKK